MKILRKFGCTAALLACATPSLAARAPKPIVITLDGHHYVTYTAPVLLSLSERLALAPEAHMSNCHRGNGLLPLFSTHRLVHSIEGAGVDVASMRIEFLPTRIVVDTLLGDVICDGEASPSETGIGRLFNDDFEVD